MDDSSTFSGPLQVVRKPKGPNIRILGELSVVEAFAWISVAVFSLTLSWFLVYLVLYWR